MKTCNYRANPMHTTGIAARFLLSAIDRYGEFVFFGSEGIIEFSFVTEINLNRYRLFGMR